VESAKISNTVGGTLVSEATSALVDFKVPINAPSAVIAGSTQTATLSATTSANIGGKDFATHTHGGVTTGAGNTGGVN